MKIGIVLSNPPGYSETFFKNKFSFLKEAGFEVYFFVDKFELCKKEHCVIGYSQGNGLLKDIRQKVIALFRFLLTPIKSYRLFKENKKDGFGLKQNLISLFSSIHILSYELDWLHFGFATVAINRENVAKVIGAKLAVSIRGYDIAIYPLKHIHCYQLLWQKIDKLHYISNDLLDLAVANGFQMTLPHQKITPAIDIEKFRYLVHPKNSILKIATVARLNWKKGLEYTLEALGFLKKAKIEFEYTIVGAGEDFERLKFASYQFDILGNVKFAGKKTQDEIIEILKETDIYIQYSIQEGFGNSVLEAQAMGCVCIVSDAEGLTENILDNRTGFVVKKRNPKLLYRKIIEVIDMDEISKLEMISNSVARLTSEFNLEIQKQRFIEFYQC